MLNVLAFLLTAIANSLFADIMVKW